MLTLSSRAIRRGSKADTPATWANDSADIHRRMEDMQTTLMQKIDEMTGIFRSELSNAVQEIGKKIELIKF